MLMTYDLVSSSKPNQVLKPAPLKPIQAAGEPFEHLIVNCVRSKSGSNCSLCCLNMLFPAALCSITQCSIVNVLTQFISVFGIPKIIQSVQGSNLLLIFFSRFQVLKQLHIKHNQSAVMGWHWTNGIEVIHKHFRWP